MQIRSAIQKINLQILAAIAAVGLATPALAGGPFEAPDDTGPLAIDFTGWTPVAFVYGGRDNATNRSRVLCVNVGTVATDVAVQWYDAGDVATRQPVLEGFNSMPPSDLDADGFETDGTVVGNVFARVIVSNKKAAIQCAGRIEVSGTPSGSLEVVYIKKTPKARISK